MGEIIRDLVIGAGSGFSRQRVGQFRHVFIRGTGLAPQHSYSHEEPLLDLTDRFVISNQIVRPPLVAVSRRGSEL